MFNPTQEQIDNNKLVESGQNVLIQAGAGAAKSTSLRYFAHQNPNKNFLVLCFNSANADESNKHPDKPNNIIYSTVHSIAYKEVVDTAMRSKLQGYLNYKDISFYDIENAGLLEGAKDVEDGKKLGYTLVRAILDGIAMFCRSDETNVFVFARNEYEKLLTGQVIIENGIGKQTPTLTSERLDILAAMTQAYWRKLIDPISKFGITHDVYLKLYQLRQLTINDLWDKKQSSFVKIDVLCLDEAQDSNPVTIAIFNNNTHLQRIVVGDRMQQLYKWRGAGEAMSLFPHFAQGSLTTSFRFPQPIADKANFVLEKANAELRIIGAGNTSEIKTKAVLCRTNASLLAVIAAAGDEGKKVFTTADHKDLFNKMYHLQAVSFNNVPKYPNKSMLDIKTRKDLKEALEVSPELSILFGLAKKIATSNNGLMTGVKKIQSCLVTKEEEADLIVTTIHKSKGLEYDEITIWDDLIALPRDESGQVDEDAVDEAVEAFWQGEEALCMLYVAITRAKVEVNFPYYLQEYFK